jgi:hypothetical protein
MKMKSLIAALIVTVIGGIIVLNVEYSFFTGKGDLSTKAENIVQETSSQLMEKNSLAFVEKDLGILETMVKAADSINVYQQRNDEYVRLIKLGLEEGKPGFAFQVATKINVYQISNEQYRAIIAYAIDHENLALAYAVAESINVYQERNIEYQKIIDKGLELRSKSSNKANSSDAQSRAAD